MAKQPEKQNEAGVHNISRRSHSIIRYQLPYPIAALYKKYCCAHTKSLRFGFALLLAEGIFRFLAYVNLASAIQHGASAKEQKNWIKGLVPPSLGKMLWVNKQCLLYLSQNNGASFIQEMNDFFEGATMKFFRGRHHG